MFLKRKRFLGLLVVAGVLCAFVLGLRVFQKPLEKRFSVSRAIYDRSGHLLRLSLTNDQKYRLWTPLKEIPSPLRKAFLLSEDRYFSKHVGFNPWSLARAAWTTYVTHERRTGASTITMQLARRLYDIDSKTVGGKVLQILRALELETLFSKNEIFEAYLNLVPFGGNIEGVGAASLVFFQRPMSKLSWSENLALAVIPQNPTKRTLLRGFNPELKQARERLFARAKKSIPRAEQRAALQSLEAKSTRDLPFEAPHFVEEILKRSPAEGEIVSTLDLRLQKLLERKLAQYVKANGGRGIKNGALLLADWTKLETVAWVGSADFSDDSILGQVNGVVSPRSPGSALKPFIYGLALDQGLIHPGTILKDSPQSFGSYDPENFDGDFHGPISAEEALNQSRNIPAVYLVSQLKKPDFYDFLLSAGVGIPRNREYYGYSIALGGFETSLLDLVSLYTSLPQQGYVSPLALSKTESKKLAARKMDRKLLSGEASFIVMDMLSRNQLQSRRYSRLSRSDTFPVSWKTGTSSGYRDAWTVGIFGPYVLGVWIGNFDGEPNPSFIGRESAAPLFFEIVEAIKASYPFDTASSLAWSPPATVKEVEICSVSGKIPGPHCHHRKKTFFIPAKSPIDVCDVHRQIWISDLTGKQTCAPEKTHAHSEILEYWSSDLLKIFSMAGLPRRKMPEPDASCTLKNGGVAAVQGRVPEILSPRSETLYSMRSVVKEQNRIPFQAVLDSDSRELYWFLDQEYLGKSKSNETFLWSARPGKFNLRAVDEKGRSASRTFNVRYVD